MTPFWLPTLLPPQITCKIMACKISLLPLRESSQSPSNPKLAGWLKIQNGAVLELHHGSVAKIFV